MVRRFIFLLLLLLSNMAGIAQAPSIQWEQSYGGADGDEYATDISLTPDGGYMIVGSSGSTNGNITNHHGLGFLEDFWVVKVDSLGTIQWEKSYGGSQSDIPNAVQLTMDGGYVVAGYTESIDGDITNHHGGIDSSDFWVIKLDAAGSLLWQKSLGGLDYDAATDIIATSDSGFVVVGVTQSTDGDVTFNHGLTDYWVVKLDADGNLDWQKTYGGSSYDNGACIILTQDGGFMIGGTSYSADGDITANFGLSDYWILKLDSNGQLLWQKSLGGMNVDAPEAILQTDAGYLIAGYTNSTDGLVIPNFAPAEIWVVKLTNNGALDWQKCYGGQGQDHAYRIVEEQNGNLTIAGKTSSNEGDVSGNHGVWDDWLIQTDSNGTLLWQHCYGGQWDEGAEAMRQTPDGGYILTGHAMMDDGDVTGNHGGHDYWVVKLNGPPLGIEKPTSTKPISIYPNPAHEAFQLTVDQKSLGINYRLVDPIGRTCLQGQLSATQTEIAIQALPAGVYTLQVIKDQTQSLRIVKQ